MSDSCCQIEIKVHLNGKLYAQRYWPHVPRKGDGIILNIPGGGRFMAMVDAVVWDEAGVASDAVHFPVAYLYTTDTDNAR